MESRPRKLLDQVRDAVQLKHYSPKTEESYVHWIKRYVLLHNKRHPNEMGEKEIETFLTHLATTKRVAASTQNQAFSALLFLYEVVDLYRNVLKKDLPHSIDAVRAKRSKHLPTVSTKAEVQKIIAA
jgi:integrase